MPSSTRGSVYRAGRFSVPVTFSVLTGRAGHPKLRDDVGIVPMRAGCFGFAGAIENTGYHRLRTRNRPYNTESVPPRLGVDALIDPEGRLPGGSFFRTGDILRFDRAGRASQIAGRCGHRPLRGRDVFRAGDILRFDLAGRTSQIAGRCGHRPLRGRDGFRAGDISRFDRAGRTSQIAGRCGHRPLRGR